MYCDPVPILCLYSDCRTLLYHFAKSKSCVTSDMFTYADVVLNIKPSLCKISKRTWSENISPWHCFWVLLFFFTGRSSLQKLKRPFVVFLRLLSQGSYWGSKRKCLKGERELCIIPTMNEEVIRSNKSSKIINIAATLLPCLRLHHCCTFERKQNLPQWSPSFIPGQQLSYWRKNGLEGQQRDRSSSSPCCCWHVHPYENWRNFCLSVKFSWLS